MEVWFRLLLGLLELELFRLVGLAQFLVRVQAQEQQNRLVAEVLLLVVPLRLRVLVGIVGMRLLLLCLIRVLRFLDQCQVGLFRVGMCLRRFRRLRVVFRSLRATFPVF